MIVGLFGFAFTGRASDSIGVLEKRDSPHVLL
jgi:hypothetical protein